MADKPEIDKFEIDKAANEAVKDSSQIGLDDSSDDKAAVAKADDLALSDTDKAAKTDIISDADTVEDVDKPSLSVQLRETFSTILWAIGIALVLRTFIFQPFHIPSGSMLPGLMKGDYIVTSKYSLGYGKYAATPLPFPRKKGRLLEQKPQRGDVIVFRPEGDNKNFIKRLVGLPGDQVQMQDGVLYINAQPVKMTPLGNESFISASGRTIPAQSWRESFPNKAEHIIYDAQKNNPNDNTSVRTVPAGYYFFMGDNRDYSSDSRVPVRAGGAGFVPAENLMGKAEIVLLSVNEKFVLYKPWTWGNMRGSRFFKSID